MEREGVAWLWPRKEKKGQERQKDLPEVAERGRESSE